MMWSGRPNCASTLLSSMLEGTATTAKRGTTHDQSMTQSTTNGDIAKTASANDAPSDDDDDGPGETDLVFRDGFPALKIPGTKWKPMVDGVEPIPRGPFWVGEDVISFHPDHLETLREDCETVFTARDKPDGKAYSEGQTFFLPANMKPRCALEALVKEIFQKHVSHLEEGTFNPKNSGANWWTLVMNDDEDTNTPDASKTEEGEEEEGEEDEVGLHFDADYELEEQASNFLLHPRLATVTYISDYGAPTLVLEQKSPPMEDLKKTTLEEGIDRAWLSHPKIGKHIAFDGRLLHGAPALYFPSRNRPEGEPKSKRQKIDKRRYTLLVNIWLNHWQLDATLLDEEICTKLKTPWEETGGNLKGDEAYTPPFEWNKNVDLGKTPEIKKHRLTPSKVDPAGEDEIALCNHTVTIKYNPTMAECHHASAESSTTEFELEKGAITLHVGGELPSDDEAEEE
eukprot:scaffold912_cov119-Cylindrotheca_fusiformis.AAC.6